jgi:predicted ATP-binding protein involved in virulence
LESKEQNAMNSGQITLYNYRCFEDSHPASVTIGPGFTALVGQNNSGKSSLLKLFYELRQFFQRVGPNGNFINLLKGSPKLEKGDTLHVTDTPDGIRLTPHDPRFAAQMKQVRGIAKKRRAVLRELA